MSDDKKRQKLPHCGGGIAGQLTGRSHLLNTDPACVIFEVCTQDSVQYILHNSSIAPFNGTLNIGQNYEFLSLSATAIRLKSRVVRCFKTTSKTTWHKVDSVNKIYHPPSLADFSNIKGKVSKIDLECGIFYFNETMPIIMSSCSRAAQVPIPKVGQEVVVYNVHRLCLKNGRTVYAMCVKSYLSIEGEDRDIAVVPPVILSPLLTSLGSRLRDYRLALCLQDCSNKLLNTMDDDFLFSCGIPLGECTNFRSSLLQKIAKLIVERSEVRKNSFLDEFMDVDHTLNCGSMADELASFSLIGLEEVDKENLSLDAEYPTDSNMSSQFSIKKVPNRFLVGVIVLKNASRRLTFNDSFGSVPCSVMPQLDQDLTGPDLSSINKKVVLVTEHYLIQEKFAWIEGDNLCYQSYRSIAVHMNKLTTLLSLSNDWRHLNNFKELPSSRQTSTSSMESPINRNSSQPMSPLCNNMKTENVLTKGDLCISPVKGQPLVNFLSQYILIQHKTSICVPKEGKFARCYLLATLLGKTVLSNSDDARRGTNTNESVFIHLDNALLAVYPFILVNSIYEIRIPIHLEVNFFKKGSPLSLIEGLKQLLPTVCCVTLPNSCEIHKVTNYKIPCVSFKFGDCYSIARTLDEANAQELINVKGYIISRFHQNPRFDREMLKVKTNGFGTPGTRIIAVVLRDTPPESQVGSPVTLYMSYWATLQYPIGLWPGTKVLFRFVVKSIGKNRSAYLRSSILTSVEVLGLAEQDDKRKCHQHLWGPRNFLSSALTDENKGSCWITVSMAQLHRLSLRAMCSFCNHQFQNGSCTYVGCSATHGSKVYSQASLKIFECELGPAVIFVSTSVVNKLFHGMETIWKMLITLTNIYGQLDFCRAEVSLDIEQMPLEQRIFRLLCMKILVGKRYHVLCRQFNSKKDSKNAYGLPALYAIDIAPVSFPLAAA